MELKDISCAAIQESVNWCDGMAEYPGVRNKILYLAKSRIATYPKLPTDESGNYKGNTYVGDFELKADEYWREIDIVPDRSQLTSDPQGEPPSQTQLNKLTAVHAGVSEQASKIALFVNNSDNIYLVQDMKGKWRVVGSELYAVKSTFSQDNGQGATGQAGSTLNVEATDVVSAPFYNGKIMIKSGEEIIDINAKE